MESKEKAKYISSEEIANIVEHFRGQYWPRPSPVDIEEVIELGLKLNIVPVPNLWTQGGVEAFLTSDFSSILVDAKFFDDDKKSARLRFALAHEVGHFILHRTLYLSLSIKSETDYIKVIKQMSHSEYNRIESQANEFAGHLLVNERELIEEIKKIRDSPERNFDPLIRLANMFKVSKQVIEKRLLTIPQSKLVA